MLVSMSEESTSLKQSRPVLVEQSGIRTLLYVAVFCCKDFCKSLPLRKE